MDGINTRWQKNETSGNFEIEKLNPFGDKGFKLFGYKQSDIGMILFILHEKGEPRKIPPKYRFLMSA